MSSDYGSELDWDETVESALQAIERTATSNPPAHIEIDSRERVLASTSTTPHINAPTLLVEALAELGAEGGQQPKKSLWERHRKWRGWGALSVSDLVAPSWCEFQHEYRLSSKAYLPPSQRPAEIISTSGETIPIDITRTVAREVILDKGKQVHSVLEKQVMGDAEKVRIDVVSQEEWWASRVLDMIVCLETLIETGRAREIKVHGFVDSFLVFGVIDEVDRRELPTPSTFTAAIAPILLPSKQANSTPTPPTSPKKRGPLDVYFSPVTSPSKKGKEKAVDQESIVADGPPLPTWGFVVSDTKTRYSNSMPPPRDSQTTKLQLMLYRRLLSSLLTPLPINSGTDSTSASILPAPPSSPASKIPPFSWSLLYAHLSLDPFAHLSASFFASIQPIIVGSSLEHTLGPATTLADFVNVLQNYYGPLLGGGPDHEPLERTLEISYRLRNNVRGWKKKETRKTLKEIEAEEIEKALKASLAEGVGTGAVADEDEEMELQRALEMSMGILQTTDVGYLAGFEEVIVAEQGILPVQDGRPPLGDEKEELPFFADPSPGLQSNNSAMDLDFDIELDDKDSPSTSFDLPPNSQLDTTHDERVPPAVPLQSRYNLRRPRSLLPSTSASPFPVPIPTLSPSPSSSAKRIKLAPPQATPLPAVHPSPSPSLTPPAPDLMEGTLIGTDVFEYNGTELDDWLQSVVRLWKGEREPIGVAIEQVSRCRTCEFESNCEWRTKKAEEAVLKNKARLAR